MFRRKIVFGVYIMKKLLKPLSKHMHMEYKGVKKINKTH